MKIRITLIIASLLATHLFATTYIQAEESEGKYIRAREVQTGEYLFEECFEQKNNQIACKGLFSDDRTFRRFQLKEIVEENERNAVYAGVADVAIIAASLYFGWILAAKASAAYYVAAGYSLDGGVAAAGGALVGTPAGTAFASAVTISIDNLNPFVHRDLSIAVEQVMDIADEDDLEDVESKKHRDGTLVVIEDLNYDQLKKKMIAQLSGLSSAN